MPNVAVTLSVRVWIEIIHGHDYGRDGRVTLSVRVWIEMVQWGTGSCNTVVTLSVRVWIEMEWVKIRNKGWLASPSV